MAECTMPYTTIWDENIDPAFKQNAGSIWDENIDPAFCLNAGSIFSSHIVV